MPSTKKQIVEKLAGWKKKNPNVGNQNVDVIIPSCKLYESHQHTEGKIVVSIINHKLYQGWNLDGVSNIWFDFKFKDGTSTSGFEEGTFLLENKAGHDILHQYLTVLPKNSKRKKIPNITKTFIDYIKQIIPVYGEIKHVVAANRVVDASVEDAVVDAASGDIVANAAADEDALVDALTDIAANVPDNAAANVPDNAATNAVVDDAADAPVDDAADGPVDDAAEGPVDAAADVPVDDAADVPVDDASDVPVDNVADGPVDAAVDTPVDNVSVEDAEGDNVMKKKGCTKRATQMAVAYDRQQAFKKQKIQEMEEAGEFQCPGCNETLEKGARENRLCDLGCSKGTKREDIDPWCCLYEVRFSNPIRMPKPLTFSCKNLRCKLNYAKRASGAFDACGSCLAYEHVQ